MSAMHDLIGNGVCLDANVMLSNLLECAHHTQCIALLRFLADREVPLRSPALLVAEVTSILHRKTCQAILSTEKTEELLTHFFKFPFLLEWHCELALNAQRLAKQMGEKVTYDASYLAVAMHYKIPLVTLDAQLLKRGRKIYRHVYSPEEFLN